MMTSMVILLKPTSPMVLTIYHMHFVMVSKLLICRHQQWMLKNWETRLTPFSFCITPSCVSSFPMPSLGILSSSSIMLLSSLLTSSCSTRAPSQVRLMVVRTLRKKNWKRGEQWVKMVVESSVNSLLSETDHWVLQLCLFPSHSSAPGQSMIPHCLCRNPYLCMFPSIWASSC